MNIETRAVSWHSAVHGVLWRVRAQLFNSTQPGQREKRLRQGSFTLGVPCWPCAWRTNRPSPRTRPQLPAGRPPAQCRRHGQSWRHPACMHEQDGVRPSLGARHAFTPCNSSIRAPHLAMRCRLLLLLLGSRCCLLLLRRLLGLLCGGLRLLLPAVAATLLGCRRLLVAGPPVPDVSAGRAIILGDDFLWRQQTGFSSRYRYGDGVGRSPAGLGAAGPSRPPQISRSQRSIAPAAAARGGPWCISASGSGDTLLPFNLSAVHAQRLPKQPIPDTMTHSVLTYVHELHEELLGIFDSLAILLRLRIIASSSRLIGRLAQKQVGKISRVSSGFHASQQQRRGTCLALSPWPLPFANELNGLPVCKPTPPGRRTMGLSKIPSSAIAARCSADLLCTNPTGSESIKCIHCYVAGSVNHHQH